MKLPKSSVIWFWLSLILIGYAGGIVTGVAVDVDQVYHTTVKKLKQKNSSGDIVVDVETGDKPQKSKKELRKEKRQKRKDERRKNRRVDKNN